jgi:hypothetical protein
MTVSLHLLLQLKITKLFKFNLSGQIKFVRSTCIYNNNNDDSAFSSQQTRLTKLSGLLLSCEKDLKRNSNKSLSDLLLFAFV